MKYHQDMKSRKKWLSGALVCIFLFFLVMVADYVIKGYYYPQKDDFESSGTGWILEKGVPGFGTTVDVNFSGEKSHYIFKTFKANDDGIRGKIIVNGNNVLLNTETFLGILREGEEYFDASFSMENLVLLISEDARSFIMLFQNTENDRFGIGKSGTMMLVYPATSKEQALEKLWDALPKSPTLQRRLVELGWE
ncbi:hypothetical protein HFM94_08475 [Faecalicatena fissicatena]|jgi:hypothetical protein|uniref:hypothetical protein n=1 Tax=Faecalicatena fissicatena TaxID=290055 RepID=UPI000EEB04B5|nr:hypothetical protein [Faecalicatena fissicatena]NSE33308.1 hypothetical protein [Faecalicatena fissicatena]HAJ39816.1 hypothetical protein [Lachnospiraceae bacterium]